MKELGKLDDLLSPLPKEKYVWIEELFSPSQEELDRMVYELGTESLRHYS